MDNKEVFDTDLDKIEIYPDIIVFERLLNLGNYGNVKIGGNFRVNNGLSIEKNMETVINKVIKLLNVYVESDSKDDYNYKFGKIKSEITRLDNFQKQVSCTKNVSKTVLSALYDFSEQYNLAKNIINMIDYDIRDRVTTLLDKENMNISQFKSDTDNRLNTLIAFIEEKEKVTKVSTIYIFEKYMCDRTCGVAVVIAYNFEEAKQLLKEYECEKYDDISGYEITDKEVSLFNIEGHYPPQVVTVIHGNT